MPSRGALPRRKNRYRVTRCIVSSDSETPANVNSLVQRFLRSRTVFVVRAVLRVRLFTTATMGYIQRYSLVLSLASLERRRLTFDLSFAHDSSSTVLLLVPKRYLSSN